MPHNAKNTTVFECHLEVKAPSDSAVDLLSQKSGLSKQIIKQAMQKGAVWISSGKQVNRLRRAKKTLKVADKLHLYYNSHILDEQPTQPICLFDEVEYSLWYKPYGVRCQASKWSDHTTIDRIIESHSQPPRSAYIIHRLDRAAQGLIIIGHTKKTTAALAKLFETRQLEKYYQVIVEGQFPSDTVTIDTAVDDKPALSHATLIEYNSSLNQSKVRVKIETGRKHQIRIHMASIGHSVIGDRLHGDATENAPDLKLCSCEFRFVCPTSHKEKHFVLPEEYRPQFE